jgi:hypothetical protein
MAIYRNKVGYVVDYSANLPVTDVTGEAPTADRWRFKLLEICHAASATVLFQNFWSEKYIFLLLYRAS